MASKRKRGESWEFIVKNAKHLDKPLYLTFKDEAEGDEYCRKLEALLDRGIVPTEHRPTTRVMTIADLVDRYTRDHAVKQRDQDVLRTVVKMVGTKPLTAIDANWVDGWISDMKRVKKLAPATIRSKVGALARCTDWGARKKLLILPDHPLRTLPEGYASYTADDTAIAGVQRLDIERERRLGPGEENAIRAVLRSRDSDLEDLFDLALETAMRLRETYTLERSQVMLDKRTVFLEKTKNGDSRQVPLSSVAMRVLTRRCANVSEGRIFPWNCGSLKLTSNYLSKTFAEVFSLANCPTLHYHDLRHEATSRLFERTNLSAEEIMKITGHRSHRMIMRYLNLRGSDLANRLW